MSKTSLLLLFGGRSDEHQISLISANGILQNLDPQRYDVTKIGISREGVWNLYRGNPFLHVDDPKKISLSNDGVRVVVDFSVSADTAAPQFYAVGKGKNDPQLLPLPRIDVIFPILHGPFGEDGTIQGVFEMAGIPYVGSGVLGSSIGMDKAVTKEILLAHKMPVTPFMTFLHDSQAGKPLRSDHPAYDWKKVTAELGTDLFVKPANMGSSVGISHVNNNAGAYRQAIDYAAKYDHKILVEKTIKGRELESAVLGHRHPRATRPAEIRPNQKHDFYSYEAKYIDPNGAELLVPAPVKAAVAKEIQELALRAFTALNLKGLARVDFFYDEPNNALYLNEVNTMPGFTPISMYPKLWQHEGVGYRELLDRLIGLAMGNEG